jgi:hypothetical protein
MMRPIYVYTLGGAVFASPMLGRGSANAGEGPRSDHAEGIASACQCLGCIGLGCNRCLGAVVQCACGPRGFGRADTCLGLGVVATYAPTSGAVYGIVPQRFTGAQCGWVRLSFKRSPELAAARLGCRLYRYADYLGGPSEVVLLFVVDAVQSAGKLTLDVGDHGVDVHDPGRHAPRRRRCGEPLLQPAQRDGLGGAQYAAGASAGGFDLAAGLLDGIGVPGLVREQSPRCWPLTTR